MSENHDDHWDPGLVNRRTLLGLIGSAAAVLGLARCGGSSGTGATPAISAAAAKTATPNPAATPTSTATTGTQACAKTLEGEVGPYFTDDSAIAYNRSNIVANTDGTSAQTGVPLALTVYVYDTEKSCAAFTGAQVDIWHCNASGVYSNESSENTSGSSWLRGYQVTGSTGKIVFTTIMPGWY